jgi:hypothetical protein
MKILRESMQIPREEVGHEGKLREKERFVRINGISPQARANDTVDLSSRERVNNYMSVNKPKTNNNKPK